MSPKLPSPYQIKKLLMYPRKLYMRQRENFEPGFLRSAMELHYYRPAFYKWLGAVSVNSQLVYEAELDRKSIVIDAGAYTGEWAQEILDRYNPTIHAFEPDPRNFRQLAKKSALNPHLVSHEFGLGDKNENVRITLEYLGSTVFSSVNARPDVESAEVKICDISDTWSQLGFDHVDLMKINIEGAEFPLLERMIETDLLGKVSCYLIQFHEWHPGAYSRRRKIRKALARTHKLAWDYHFVWEKWVLK